ncbi:MAG: radical SAM protein, partial [Muribaculaceae bacterium]|nr:radical SAM protein [Muribaculaceae bacterium]
GCKMGCRFCVTGKQGFHGSLTAADILNQLFEVDAAIKKTNNQASIHNVVFMGMGEPMDNYDAVRQTIDVMTAEWGLAWSPQRITVSTVGIIPTLKRLLDETRCHVAVSLHNPFLEEREAIMPVECCTWHTRSSSCWRRAPGETLCQNPAGTAGGTGWL